MRVWQKICVVLISFCAVFPVTAVQPGVGVDLTGDILKGVPVISALKAKELPSGRHRFYFRAGWRNTGEPIHVPVEVLKGEEPGKTLLITAGVHGDELNGIRVLHLLMASLSPKKLKGTIISVPGINQTGMNANSRHYLSSAANGAKEDPNRRFPGKLSGSGSAALYIGNIWHNLLKNNADIAVDLHTQTTGTEYPLFVFSDFRNAKSKALAMALMPDIIKNDEGQSGTLETTFMQIGVPAVTFELGAPKVFQTNMIRRAVLGLKNVLVVEGFTPGEEIKPITSPFIGQDYTNVYSKEGGVTVVHVNLLEKVEKGQHIATVFDGFGEEVRKYYAPHKGRILAKATDPLREAGAMIVRIIR